MASKRNNSLLFFLCIFAISSHKATSLVFEDHVMSLKHEQWMTRHGRSYDSKEEKEKRFKIFKDNVNYIESFNRAGRHTHSLAINAFADLTQEEFLTKYTGYKPSSQIPRPSSFKYENVQEVPPSLDWRLLGAVTPVQNQGGCGSCWAFSAVAAIEAIDRINTGYLIPLSEQQILDCDDSKFDGCQGATMEQAFQFVISNGGLASDTDYPYQTREQTCDSNAKSSLAAPINGYERVSPNNETAMLLAVANQPISVGIDPSLFQFYSGGVLRGDCGKTLTHAVTAVGYGVSEDGIRFWLMKNSWGEGWGESGYIRIERGIDGKEGMCGLAMDLSYPTI